MEDEESESEDETLLHLLHIMNKISGTTTNHQTTLKEEDDSPATVSQRNGNGAEK